MLSQKQTQEDIKHTTCINTRGRSLKSVYNVNSVLFDPRTDLDVYFIVGFFPQYFQLSCLQNSKPIMVSYHKTASFTILNTLLTLTHGKRDINECLCYEWCP